MAVYRKIGLIGAAVLSIAAGCGPSVKRVIIPGDPPAPIDSRVPPGDPGAPPSVPPSSPPSTPPSNPPGSPPSNPPVAPVYSHCALDSPSQPLHLNAPLRTLNRILSESDTNLLKSYTVKKHATSAGKQYLDFSGGLLTPVYARTQGIDGFYLFARNGEEVFTHRAEFADGLRSRVNPNGRLVDLAGGRVNMFGERYSLSAIQNGKECVLRLSGDGGEDEDDGGDDDGIRLAIRDSDSSDVQYAPGGLYVNGVQISNVAVLIDSQSVPGGLQEIKSIKLKVTAPRDLYVPVQGLLSAELSDVMLSSKWDLRYHGPRSDGTHEVCFVEK